MSGYKQQVFYIHGGESFLDKEKFLERLRTKGIWDLPGKEQKGKWTETLQEDLGEDFEVFMPQMPNKWNASYEEWKIWFERHFEYLQEGVILVGCSLGAMFLSKYLIENKLPFHSKAVFIMASPVEMGGFDDSDCGDFVFPLEKVGNIAKQADKVFLLHSEDDFLVPYEHVLKYHEALPEAELVTFTDKNHFLVPELPELVGMIKEVAGK